jgi:hypothetical protein
MKDKISWALSIISLLLIPIGYFSFRTLERLVPSFPDFILGDYHLTRECNPVRAVDYQSSEFIIDLVDLSQVKSGQYIHLQEDLILWDPYYPGYPRTDLSRAEIEEFYQVLSNGYAFREINVEVGFNRLEHPPGKDLTWVPFPEGEIIDELYDDLVIEAKGEREVGVLQLELWSGELVEVMLYPGEDGLAFDPTCGASPWYFRGVSREIPGSLEEIRSRAEVEPIELLWPDKTSSQANAKAERILGRRYGKALEAVRGSTFVWKNLGTIKEIRPALGQNTLSEWPGCSSIVATLYIQGSQAEATAIVRGDECFHINLVVEGVPVYGGWREICP